MCAPAGFGKPRLLTQWLADAATARHDPSRDDARPQPSVAWLSLEAGDSDLRRFLTHLLIALQTTASDVGVEALATLDSARPGNHDPVADFHAC